MTYPGDTIGCYLAPTPVSLPASHPRGVCRPALREPTAPPPPSESGLADANDSLRAFAASWTACQDRRARTCIQYSTHTGIHRGRLTGAVNLTDIGLKYQTTLDDLSEDVVRLRGNGCSEDILPSDSEHAATHLVKVKDQIELAYVLECAIERLDEDLGGTGRIPNATVRRAPCTTHLYQIQYAELTLRTIHHEHEVQRSIASVHHA